MPSMEPAPLPPPPQSGGSTPSPAKHSPSPGGRHSGSSTPRGGNAQLSTGAEVYRALMAGYHRRLRAPAPMPSYDRAGLLNKDANFHGRGTPLKAKVPGPKDGNEAQFRLSKRFIPGRSHMAQPDLLVHNPLNQSMDSAMFSLAIGQTRPSLRVCEGSYKDHLQGGGLVCIKEDPPPRRMLNPGQYSDTMRVSTKPRVMVHAEDVAPAPGTEVSPRGFLDKKWQAQLEKSKDSLSNEYMPPRPSTAPPTEARMRYHQVNTANQDVFNYRHSGGICPKDYKMDVSNRTPAPQIVTPSPKEARESWQANQDAYAHNRVRGILSRTCLYS